MCRCCLSELHSTELGARNVWSINTLGTTPCYPAVYQRSRATGSTCWSSPALTSQLIFSIALSQRSNMYPCSSCWLLTGKRALTPNVITTPANIWLSTASKHNLSAHIVAAVEATNNAQKQKLFDLIASRFGPDLSGLTIGLWGLSFKPNSDDMREAPSIALIENALAAGATIKAFDPEAMDVCAELFGNESRLHYCANKEGAITGADCLAICTEWRNFWSPDFQEMKHLLKTPVIFDGRNLYDPIYLQRLGIEYFGVGRGLSAQINRGLTNETSGRGE